MRLSYRVIASIMVISAAFAQKEPEYASPLKLPHSVADDTYSIYEQVLPSNAIEWSDVRRSQWLLEENTTALPLGTPCETSGPHKDVTPPIDRRSEWSEVMQDYDSRCHDRYILDSTRIQESIPVRLLNEDAQKQYQRGVSGFMPPPGNIMQAPPTPNDFKGAAGLHSFSAVYFNRAHTLAAVHFGMFCGSLCGNWTWIALEKSPNGTWKRLPWVHTFTMS